MKKIKLILIFLLAYISQSVIAQENLRQNLLKYWYYKDRLKYFVVPGTQQGESEIVCLRNRGDIDATWSNINFGQHGVNFGYYLGTLATEYRLLMDNGNTADAQITRNELNLALQQFNNWMDKTSYYGDTPNNENGFFVRDNVPCDFVDNTDTVGNPLGKFHYDQLNQDLDPIANAWNESDGFNGLPNGHPGPISSVSECGNPSAMSQDEAVGVLMGLALVRKCMPITESLMACQMAYRIINYVHYAPNPADHVPYLIYDPNGDLVSEGNTAVFNSMGFAHAGSYFGWDISLFTDPISVTEGIMGFWQSQQFDIITFDYNRHMASTLAAIGDSWRVDKIINSTGDGINRVTQEYETNTFYLLLWAYLHDKNTGNTNLVNSKSLAESQMNDAPCEGPYYFNPQTNSGYPNGWGYNYKWRGKNWEHYGLDPTLQDCGDDPCNRSSGVFNGLDYMLFFNLYHLFYGVPMADYHYYNNRSLYGFFPVCMGSHFPIGETCHHVWGCDTDPIKAYSFDKIECTTNVNNTVINADPALPITGNVTLIAGKEIKLLPGFKVESGAYFHASIDDFNDCNEFNTTNRLVNTDSITANANDSVILKKENGYAFASFPNPFSGTTNINYTIPCDGNVKITVSNTYGIKIADILNEQKTAGTFSFIYDASALSPDIYFFTLLSNDYRKTIKMVLLKE